MNWQQRYGLRRFLKASLWPLPLLSMAIAPAVAYLTFWLDRKTGWTLDVSADAARNVVSTLVGSLLAFIVFIFSFLLVAVQLASAQLTARIIARVFMDLYTKAALAIFVFSYAYSLVFLARVQTPVYLISGLLCGYGTLVCLAVFLLLIDRLGKELRPVRILTSVAAEGRAVIRSIYPQRVSEHKPVIPAERLSLGEATSALDYQGAPGHLLAFDEAGLLRLAQQSDCIIELVPQVGDFLAPEDALIRVYERGRAVDQRQLRTSVAFGPERTLEQDPTFAFRIIVDIASKALSPAINDPTTAVLAIDQIHHLLREVGMRRLLDGGRRDAAGNVRLVFRTPNWEDFVQLSVTEIRQFGRESIQVARRLRAMLDNLIQILPESRTVLLRQELQLLHRSVDRIFPDPEDRALAEIGDFQGVGGTYGNHPKREPCPPNN